MYTPVSDSMRFEDEPNMDEPNMMEKVFSTVNKFGRKIKRAVKNKFEKAQEMAETTDPLQNYFNKTNKVATKMRGRKNVKFSHDEDPMEALFKRSNKIERDIEKVYRSNDDDDDLKTKLEKKTIKSGIKQLAVAAAKSRL